MTFVVLFASLFFFCFNYSFGEIENVQVNVENSENYVSDAMRTMIVEMGVELDENEHEMIRLTSDLEDKAFQVKAAITNLINRIDLSKVEILKVPVSLALLSSQQKEEKTHISQLTSTKKILDQQKLDLENRYQGELEQAKADEILLGQLFAQMREHNDMTHSFAQIRQHSKYQALSEKFAFDNYFLQTNSNMNRAEARDIVAQLREIVFDKRIEIEKEFETQSSKLNSDITTLSQQIFESQQTYDLRASKINILQKQEKELQEIVDRNEILLKNAREVLEMLENEIFSVKSFWNFETSALQKLSHSAHKIITVFSH